MAVISSAIFRDWMAECDSQSRIKYHWVQKDFSWWLKHVSVGTVWVHTALCVISYDMQAFIPSHMSYKYTVILKATLLSVHNGVLPISQHPGLVCITIILCRALTESPSFLVLCARYYW